MKKHIKLKRIKNKYLKVLLEIAAGILLFTAMIIWTIIMGLPDIIESNIPIWIRLIRCIFFVFPFVLLMYSTYLILSLGFFGALYFRYYRSEGIKQNPWIKSLNFKSNYSELCGVRLDTYNGIYLGFLKTLIDIKDTYGTDETINVLNSYNNLNNMKSIVKFSLDNCKGMDAELKKSIDELHLLSKDYSCCDVYQDLVIETLEDFERIFTGYKLKTKTKKTTYVYKGHPKRILRYTDNSNIAELLGELIGKM